MDLGRADRQHQLARLASGSAASVVLIESAMLLERRARGVLDRDDRVADREREVGAGGRDGRRQRELEVERRGVRVEERGEHADRGDRERLVERVGGPQAAEQLVDEVVVDRDAEALLPSTSSAGERRRLRDVTCRLRRPRP